MAVVVVLGRSGLQHGVGTAGRGGMSSQNTVELGTGRKLKGTKGVFDSSGGTLPTTDSGVAGSKTAKRKHRRGPSSRRKSNGTRWWHRPNPGMDGRRSEKSEMRNDRPKHGGYQKARDERRTVRTSGSQAPYDSGRLSCMTCLS